MHSQRHRAQYRGSRTRAERARPVSVCLCVRLYRVRMLRRAAVRAESAERGARTGARGHEGNSERPKRRPQVGPGREDSGCGADVHGNLLHDLLQDPLQGQKHAGLHRTGLRCRLAPRLLHDLSCRIHHKMWGVSRSTPASARLSFEV